MAQRPDLQAVLVGLLGSDQVYFQPPPSVQMQYPCIVYNRENEDRRHANNRTYAHKKRYTVTVIDANPDSPIPDRVGNLPLASYDRFYTSDNLNHDVYTLFF